MGVDQEGEKGNETKGWVAMHHRERRKEGPWRTYACPPLPFCHYSDTNTRRSGL